MEPAAHNEMHGGTSKWTLPAKVRVQGPPEALSGGLGSYYNDAAPDTRLADVRRRHFAEKRSETLDDRPGKGQPRNISPPPPETVKGKRRYPEIEERPYNRSQKHHASPPLSKMDEKLFQSLGRVMLDGVRQADRFSKEVAMESQMNRKIRQVDQGARSNGIPSPPQVDLYRMDVDYNLRHTTRGLDHKEWLFEKEYIQKIRAARDADTRPSYFKKQMMKALEVSKQEVASLPKYPKDTDKA